MLTPKSNSPGTNASGLLTARERSTKRLLSIGICRYLKGAKGSGLMFTPTQSLELSCYVDADFGGLWNYENDQDSVCVKSRTRYVMTLGGSPILWNSKLQTEIALSTTEAEYIALSQAMREYPPSSPS